MTSASRRSHRFNLLDARGAISVTERAAYIGRVRDPGEGLLRGVAGGGDSGVSQLLRLRGRLSTI